jgi:hypothetical protein
MNRFTCLFFLGLVALVLVSVNGADAARKGCVAFGKPYKDGESYTISTDEYGYRETYVCVDGIWYYRPT